MNIYYIGGSPCAGKSTVAELLAQKYDLYYFKVDDFLDKYMEQAAVYGGVCAKLMTLSGDGIWMRDPVLQCAEEFAYYDEVFPFVQADLRAIASDAVITEGAAFVPQLMHKIGVPQDRYISITPTPEFQVEHYRQRPWVPHILRECREPDEAFARWMRRDMLFAEDVQRQCAQFRYASIVNDGYISIDEMCAAVERQFGLK